MPNVTYASPTAHPAVAPDSSAVNDVLERAEDISDRLYVACIAARRELEDFIFDRANELDNRHSAFAKELLDIEIAAHDLDELVEFINKLTA